MPPVLHSFAADHDPQAVGDALLRDGVVILRDLAPAATMDRLMADVSPTLAEREPGGGKFFGFRTKRLGGIAGRSRAFAEIMSDPRLLALADRALLPNCQTYQIQIASCLQVWRGGELQPLHRDIGVYHPYVPRVVGGPEILLSTMLAGCDFTAENGATRIVPGSHRWEPEREATEADVVQAVMPRGSMAVWLGSVLHGMGINRTDEPRAGFPSGFVVGWLRQEENQYLACPPEFAATLPERAQQLLGYCAHSAILGWVEDRDKEYLLKPGKRSDHEEGYADQPLQDM